MTNATIFLEKEIQNTVTLRETCLVAAWGHDLIEDARCSFNDVKRFLGPEVAEIVYAVTNEKGKNRKERANDKYYADIRDTPGAVYVKLCDRIANVTYSKMVGSSMFDMYKKENEEFVTQLGWKNNVSHIYEIMFTKLLKLFEDEK